MKMIQTFWTGPKKQDEHNLLRLKAGWSAAEYHWMSWALSCLQVLEQYGQVELVTDNNGKKILIDILQLPYTTVSTALEGTLDQYPEELWSLAKVFTYSIQQEPFIHLDGDVFIWQPFEERIMKGAVIAQNIEIDLAYYRNTLAELQQHFTYLPPVLGSLSLSSISLYASNAGIFGGHALDFIGQYCREAFLLVEKNRMQLDKVKKNLLNFIFEQCLLYYMGAAEGVSFTYLKKEPVTDPTYMDYARFLDVPQVDMIHPVGGYKKMPFICDHLAKRLRKDHPAYYYHIIDTCRKKGDELKNRIYYFPPFNQPEFFPATYNACLHGSSDIPALPYPAIPSDYSTVFARTVAALHYLKIMIPDPDLLAEVIGKMDDAEQKGRIMEIFQLESAIHDLTKKFNDLPALIANYFNDLRHYAAIEHIFLQPEQELMNTILSAGNDSITMELGHQWSFSASQETLEHFIERKFTEDGSLEQVVLQINASGPQITETYLDKLDMIIISVCAEPLSTAVILQQVIEFFDPEEINNSYNSFKKLLFDSLKRLMYTGMLRIS